MNLMMNESFKNLSKECLVEPATLVVVGECQKRVGTAKTPLFVVTGIYSSTIELSPLLSG